jgi:hypothetical protein
VDSGRIGKNGKGEVGSSYDTLSQQLDAKRFTDAEPTLDAIFKIIEK